MDTPPTAITQPEDPRYSGWAQIERVAQVHYLLRPQLERTLDTMLITPEGKAFNGGHDTYGAYWRASFGDRYFDMGTAQRLGTAIETGLRYYHKGMAQPDRAAEVARHSRGIFQRLVQPDELVKLFRTDCSVDLSTNPAWRRVREIMVHRHLFAHRSGLVDEKYLTDLHNLTGSDLRPTIEAYGYPDEDVYWFAPLDRLGELIESARIFFLHLPHSNA